MNLMHSWIMQNICDYPKKGQKWCFLAIIEWLTTLEQKSKYRELIIYIMGIYRCIARSHKKSASYRDARFWRTPLVKNTWVTLVTPNSFHCSKLGFARLLRKQSISVSTTINRIWISTTLTLQAVCISGIIWQIWVFFLIATVNNTNTVGNIFWEFSWWRNVGSTVDIFKHLLDSSRIHFLESLRVIIFIFVRFDGIKR